MTRIRYAKLEGSTVLESVQSFQVGAELAKLELSTTALEFRLRTASGTILASGTATTLAALKRAAKAALATNGVTFDAEVRQRVATGATDLEMELIEPSEQAS